MNGNSDKNDVFQKYLQYSTLGFEFVSALVIFLLMGYFADKYFDTRPVGILIGAIAGVGLGLYSFIRNAMKIDKKFSDKNRHNESE